MGKTGKRRLSKAKDEKKSNETGQPRTEWILENAEYFDANFDLSFDKCGLMLHRTKPRKRQLSLSPEKSDSGNGSDESDEYCDEYWFSDDETEKGNEPGLVKGENTEGEEEEKEEKTKEDVMMLVTKRRSDKSEIKKKNKAKRRKKNSGDSMAINYKEPACKKRRINERENEKEGVRILKMKKEKKEVQVEPEDKEESEDEEVDCSIPTTNSWEKLSEIGDSDPDEILLHENTTSNRVIIVGNIVIDDNSILKKTTLPSGKMNRVEFNNTVKIAKIESEDHTKVRFCGVKCLKEDDLVYATTAGAKELRLEQTRAGSSSAFDVMTTSNRTPGRVEADPNGRNIIEGETANNDREWSDNGCINERNKGCEIVRDDRSSLTEILFSDTDFTTMGRKAKPRVCTTCNAQFGDDTSLRTHMNSHKEERRVDEPGEMVDFQPGVSSTQKLEVKTGMSDATAEAIEDMDDTYFNEDEWEKSRKGREEEKEKERVKNGDEQGQSQEMFEESQDGQEHGSQEEDGAEEETEDEDEDDVTIMEDEDEDGEATLEEASPSPNLLEREKGRAKMEQDRKLREKERVEREKREKMERERLKREEALKRREQKQMEKQLAAKEERNRKEAEKLKRLKKAEDLKLKHRATASNRVVASKLTTRVSRTSISSNNSMRKSVRGTKEIRTTSEEVTSEEKEETKERKLPRIPKVKAPAPQFMVPERGSARLPAVSATYARNMINGMNERYDMKPGSPAPRVIIPSRTGQDPAFTKALKKMEKDDNERMKSIREKAEEERREREEAGPSKGGAKRGLNSSRKKTTPVVATGRVSKQQKTTDKQLLSRLDRASKLPNVATPDRSASAVTAAVAALGRLNTLSTASPKLKPKKGRPKKMESTEAIENPDQITGSQLVQELGQPTGLQFQLHEGENGQQALADETGSTVAERSEMETGGEEDQLLNDMQRIENEAMIYREKLTKSEGLATDLKAKYDDLVFRLDRAERELGEACAEKRDLKQKLEMKAELFRRVFPDIPLEAQDNFMKQVDEKLRALNLEIQQLNKLMMEKESLNKQLLQNNAETSQQLANMTKERDDHYRRANALERCIPCEVKGCNASICPRNHEVTTIKSAGKRRVNPCQWFWASFEGCAKGDDCPFSHEKPSDAVILKEYNQEIDRLKVLMAKKVVKTGGRSGEKRGARARSNSRGRNEKRDVIEVADSPSVPPQANLQQANLQRQVLPPAPFPQQVSKSLYKGKPNVGGDLGLDSDLDFEFDFDIRKTDWPMLGQKLARAVKANERSGSSIDNNRGTVDNSETSKNRGNRNRSKKRKRGKRKGAKMKKVITLPVKIINLPSNGGARGGLQEAQGGDQVPKYNNYAGATAGILGAVPSDSPAAKRKREEELNVNAITAGNMSSQGMLRDNKTDWFSVMFHGTLGESVLAGMMGSYPGNASGVHALGAAGSLNNMTNLSSAAKMKAMGREFASTNYQRDLGQLTPARPVQSTVGMDPNMGSFASQMAGTMNTFQQSQNAAQNAFQQEQELKMKQLQEQIAAMSSMIAGGNPMQAGAGLQLQQGAHHLMGTLQQAPPQATGVLGAQSPVVGQPGIQSLINQAQGHQLMQRPQPGTPRGPAGGR